MEEDLYGEVESLIAGEKLDEAQQLLDGVNERDARWHFLQSELYRHKNWLNECRKQLEIAVALEPDNAKYINALSSLQYEGKSEEPEKKKAKRKRNMGGTDEGVATCAACCAECACQGLCEAICDGLS